MLGFSRSVRSPSERLYRSDAAAPKDTLVQSSGHNSLNHSWAAGDYRIICVQLKPRKAAN